LNENISLDYIDEGRLLIGAQVELFNKKLAKPANENPWLLALKCCYWDKEEGSEKLLIFESPTLNLPVPVVHRKYFLISD
jgi:hypothetical protein